jgi:hypothetical protein
MKPDTNTMETNVNQSINMSLEKLFDIISHHLEQGGVVIAGYRDDDFVVKDADYVPFGGGLDQLGLYGRPDMGCKLLLSDRVDTLSEIVGGIVTYTFSDNPNDKGRIKFLTNCKHYDS